MSRQKLSWRYDDGGRSRCHFKSDRTGDCGARAMSIVWRHHHQHVPEEVAYLRALLLASVDDMEIHSDPCDTERGPFLSFEGQMPSGVNLSGDAAAAIGYRRYDLTGYKVSLDAVHRVVPRRAVLIGMAGHYTTMVNGTIRDAFDPRDDKKLDADNLQQIWLRDDQHRERDLVKLWAVCLGSSAQRDE